MASEKKHVSFFWGPAQIMNKKQQHVSKSQNKDHMDL